MQENVKYVIVKNNLHKFKEGDSEPIILEPTKTGRTKYDRHFRNAEEVAFEFTNTGTCVDNHKRVYMIFILHTFSYRE